MNRIRLQQEYNKKKTQETYLIKVDKPLEENKIIIDSPN